MCQIIVNAPNSILLESELKNSCKYNSDGFGIAYTENNQLKLYKTMRQNTFINKYFKIRLKNPSIYILLHTRLATHGKSTVDNCHPFKVTKDICLAHNGVLSGFGSHSESDTKDFIKSILQPIEKSTSLNDLIFNPKNEWFHTLLKQAIDSNKFAFLNNLGKIAIINSDAGNFDKVGNWFSNDSHKSYSCKNYYSDYDDFGYGAYAEYFCNKCHRYLASYQERQNLICWNCFNKLDNQTQTDIINAGKLM